MPKPKRPRTRKRNRASNDNAKRALAVTIRSRVKRHRITETSKQKANPLSEADLSVGVEFLLPRLDGE